MYTGCI